MLPNKGLINISALKYRGTPKTKFNYDRIYLYKSPRFYFVQINAIAFI